MCLARLADNPALHAACLDAKKNGATVLPVYVFSDRVTQPPIGAASLWWLQKSLRCLQTALGRHLLVIAGDPCRRISEIVQQTDAKALYFNRRYEPSSIDQESLLVARLDKNGVTVHSFCLLYTSPSPRDRQKSRMPSSA